MTLRYDDSTINIVVVIIIIIMVSPDSGVNARSAAHVSDVDGVQNIILAAVCVQVKLDCGSVSNRYETNATGQGTVGSTVHRQHLHQLGD